ncbi:hypothetical protein IB62_008640 [Xanthomonas euvesicatoria]|nr:hypothetical protein IB62_008640 [Xanthomonas euvesicatoria]
MSRLAAWARRATRSLRATGRFPEDWPPAARSARRAACLDATAKPPSTATPHPSAGGQPPHLKVHDPLWAGTGLRIPHTCSPALQ